MKILFVMPTHISFGGIESIGINLWNGLKELGHEVDFVCHGSQKGYYEQMILDSGSNVYHIPIKGKDFRGAKEGFKCVLMNHKYDVVHAHMNATSGIYLRIAKEMGIPILAAHSHASSITAITHDPIKILINEIEKWPTNRYANLKIACSDKAGNWLYGKHPFLVIPNAVDVKRFVYSEEKRERKREELNIPSDAFVAIHIGGFLKCKNHGFLMDILRLIKEKRPKTILIMAGEGPTQEAVRKKAEKYHLQDRVRFLGERTDVDELLQAADIFFLPSFSEGDPISLIEAAVSGLKCLVSERVSHVTARYFEQNQIMYLPIGSENAAKRWAALAAAPYERIRYTDRSLCKLTIKRITRQVEEAYLSVEGNVNV